MARIMDLSPAGPSLIGEWKFVTVTTDEMVLMIVLSVLFLPLIALFGVGIFLIIMAWAIWGGSVRIRKFKTVRVYPDRVEQFLTMNGIIESRMEASKIETVGSVVTKLSKGRYGSVGIIGSGGTKMSFSAVERPEALAVALREISSAPVHKDANGFAAKSLAQTSEQHKSETTEFKLCPMCAEEVKLQAIKCKHCGSAIS